MAVQVEALLAVCEGFQEDGENFKFYVTGPNPEPSFDRERGVRTSLFHLVSGEDAVAVRRFLTTHRCWEVMRVPPAYTRERGIAAIRVAGHWHSGQRSPLYLFASTRTIHGDGHREQLRREVNALVGSVLENPVSESEFPALTLLREIVNTAPLNVELCTAREISE
jgi:hypothetical protein